MQPLLGAASTAVGGSSSLVGSQLPQILGACLGTGQLLASLSRAAGSRGIRTSAAPQAAAAKPAVSEEIETVTVKVNSRPVTVAKDSSILSACEAIGVGVSLVLPLLR
jgi:hypothetical protein